MNTFKSNSYINKGIIGFVLLSLVLFSNTNILAQSSASLNIEGEWTFEKAEAHQYFENSDSVIIVAERDKINLGEMPWVETVIAAKFFQGGGAELNFAGSGSFFGNYQLISDNELLFIPMINGNNCPECPKEQGANNAPTQPAPITTVKSYKVQYNAGKLNLVSEYMFGKGRCVYSVTLKKSTYN